MALDPDPRGLTLVAILTVRAGADEAFRDFETRAASIMARHGGAIERVVVVPAASPDELRREVHVVTFPDAAALVAYRADAGLAALADLRADAIASTDILIGRDAAPGSRSIA